MRSSTAMPWLVQPVGHLKLSGISFTDNVYSEQDSNGVNKIFTGAELASDGTEGYLAVHLINDAADSWYLIPLMAGGRVGAIFDMIGDATKGTTITVAEAVVFRE